MITFQYHADKPMNLKAEIAALEKAILLEVLEMFGMNRAHAARHLGMNRTTLLEKLRRHGFQLNTPAPRDL